MDTFDSAKRLHREVFGAAPEVIARAPGRVNLIGEHTDYNDGLVLPVAIDQALYVTGRRRPGDHVAVDSRAMGEAAEVAIDIERPAPSGAWWNYVGGVVAGLRRRGAELDGCELCVSGDLPPGGGASSSAALCVGAALAIAALYRFTIDPIELVALAQNAEHEFAGTPCGIMDPFVCVFAKAGNAVLIDCRRRSHEYVPLKLGTRRLLLIDSGIRHELATGAYERRVRECQEAAAKHVGRGSLGDVTAAELGALRARMGDVSFRRARHVVTENDRVMQTVAALKGGRIEELGRILDQGHRSLRDDYEVSCPEIEQLIIIVRGSPGVLGARMIGGGFGGNLLAIAESEAVAGIVSSVERVGGTQGSPPRVIPVESADGAECHRC